MKRGCGEGMHEAMALLDDPEYTLHLMHKRQREQSRRMWRQRRFSRARGTDPRKELAGRAEHVAQVRLEGMGYQVSRQEYNAPFDLLCEGARVEVKGASWSGERYQGAIRNHEADLLLFGCDQPGGELDFFVIPAEAYAGRRHLAVWTEVPGAHRGRWFEFWRAWWWVEAVMRRVSEHRDWQRGLL